VCVCSLSYPAYKAHVPYYVVTYGLSGSTFFWHIISKRLDFRKNIFNIRCVQINHQPDTTIFQFITLTFIYRSTCFGRSPAHHQELNDCSSSLWFYLRIVVTVVLCLWLGRSARPRTQHGYHHDTKVKPEATTAALIS
jgi:hypothetical protein